MAYSSVFSTDNQYIKYQIELIQNSQNITNNTSNITVKIWIYRTNNYETYGSGTITYKINGTTYTEALDSNDKITSTKKAFATKTVTINHSADGSKTVACSASISHSQFSSSTNSYNFKLTTIPRASTPTTVGDVNIGSAIQINTNRASSSFTHTLTYKFGSASGTIATGVGSTYNWTIPVSLANQIKSATSGTLTITCQTFSGSTSIGTKSITRTAYVPNTAAFKPTISAVTINEANTTNKLAQYIQGISKLKVVTTAAGGYSDINSIKVAIEGTTYTGSTITSGVLKNSGAATATITATDSRGRTVTITRTYSVSAYTAPKITSFTATRCLANGTVTDEGEYLKIDITTAITSVTNNATSLTLGYKLKTATSYTNIANTKLDTTPTYSYTTSFVTTEVFSNNNRYDILLTLKDSFSTVTKSISIGTASPVYDIKADGSAICFGGVANESDTFDIRFPTTILSPNVYLESRKDQSTEKNIHFSNVDDTAATNKHNCKLYGGNGGSTSSIGVWDITRNQGVWTYRTGNQALDFNPNVRKTGFDSICIAGIASNYSISSTNTEQLTLTATANEIIGTGLTVSGGTIVIGANIAAVKICASIYCSSGYMAGDKIHMNILKNGSVVATAITNCTATYFTLSVPTKIISVSQGDTISLAIRNEMGARGVIGNSRNATFLTCEVVN